MRRVLYPEDVVFGIPRGRRISDATDRFTWNGLAQVLAKDIVDCHGDDSGANNNLFLLFDRVCQRRAKIYFSGENNIPRQGSMLVGFNHNFPMIDLMLVMAHLAKFNATARIKGIASGPVMRRLFPPSFFGLGGAVQRHFISVHYADLEVDWRPIETNAVGFLNAGANNSVLFALGGIEALGLNGICHPNRSLGVIAAAAATTVLPVLIRGALDPDRYYFTLSVHFCPAFRVCRGMSTEEIQSEWRRQIAQAVQTTVDISTMQQDHQTLRL